MKRLCAILSILLVVLFLSWRNNGPSHVIVGSTTNAVPPGSELDTDEFRKFWSDLHSDEWNQQYNITCFTTVRNRTKVFSRYRRALVERAAEINLPPASLGNVLDAIADEGERHHIAYLPFAAYYITGGPQPVWLVDLGCAVQTNAEPVQLYGRRSFAFTAESLTPVGFTAGKGDNYQGSAGVVGAFRVGGRRDGPGDTGR